MSNEWGDEPWAEEVFAAIDAAWVAPPERLARVNRLFLEKLAARRPDHPWVRRLRMSWSGSAKIPAGTTPEDFGKRGGILEQMTVTGNEDCLSERGYAVDAAKSAAVVALRSGAFGDVAAHGWSIVLSGHCNPGNAKRPGWSNDCVTISITQTE